MLEAERKAAAGSVRDDRRLTLQQYLVDWLKDKAKNAKPTTIKDYSRHISLDICPRLGAVRLQALRTRQISEMTRALIDEGRGTPTVRRIHATLSSALGDAVRQELIERNPAANAWLPRQQKTKVNPWEPDEIGMFLTSITEDPWKPIFELAVLTGLRRGELLGLRWTDIKANEGYLVVWQQVVDLKGDVSCPVCSGSHHNLGFSTPKTASGTARRVELGLQALELLDCHRLLQSAHISLWGSAYTEHDLVFSRDDGAPIHPERVTKRFAQMVKNSGLRHQRLHDLRHAHASLLLAAGYDLAIVSKLLGHSSFSLTADTYSHLVGGVGKRAADAVGDLIARGPRDQSVTKMVSASGPDPPV